MKIFVPILYRDPAFDAFDDFSDIVESISCEGSESCQVRGSNPCRGANSQNWLFSRFPLLPVAGRDRNCQ
jgi:hypothetical protein